MLPHTIVTTVTGTHRVYDLTPAQQEALDRFEDLLDLGYSCRDAVVRLRQEVAHTLTVDDDMRLFLLGECPLSTTPAERAAIRTARRDARRIAAWRARQEASERAEANRSAMASVFAGMPTRRADADED